MSPRKHWTHELLLQIVPKRPEDYQPWGEVERWKDDDPYPDCSCGCRHYVPFPGRLGGDWGTCVNPQSHRAGLLTFEHQGCRKGEP